MKKNKCTRSASANTPRLSDKCSGVCFCGAECAINEAYHPGPCRCRKHF